MYKPSNPESYNTSLYPIATTIDPGAIYLSLVIYPSPKTSQNSPFHLNPFSRFLRSTFFLSKSRARVGVRACASHYYNMPAYIVWRRDADVMPRGERCATTSEDHSVSTRAALQHLLYICTWISSVGIMLV